jgi:hypothetical protein
MMHSIQPATGYTGLWVWPLPHLRWFISPEEDFST